MLYVMFIDLTKSFDTLNRRGMVQIVERLGCPPKFPNMTIQLHENLCDPVRPNSDLSKPFLITNELIQYFCIVDDIALVAHTKGALQYMTSCSIEAD